MTLHQRATSLGTKRGVRPYWNRYRRGKEKATQCPFHRYCLNHTFGSTPTHHKRDLYANHCSTCLNREGYVRADKRGRSEKSGSRMGYDNFEQFCRYWRNMAREEAKRQVMKKMRSDPKDLAFAKRWNLDTSQYEDVDYDALRKKLFMERYDFVVREAKKDGLFQLMKTRWLEAHPQGVG